MSERIVLHGAMPGRLDHFAFLPRAWIAGGDYSIADMATEPWAHYLERHGFDPAEHPALVAWRQRIASRPAVQRARDRQTGDFQAAATRSRKSATAEDLDRFFGRTAEVPTADYSIVSKM